MSVKTQTYRPTLNAGQVYLKNTAIDGPKIAIGNVSALSLEISEDEKSLTDYTQPGGGQWAALSRVSGINASMTLHDLDPLNLARAIYGDTSAVAAGTATPETHTAYQGGLLRLARPAPTNVVVTFTAPTWTAEKAYLLGDTITDGTAIQECTTAGTSGGTAPTWSTTLGGTTADGAGALVWTHRGAATAIADSDYEVRPEGILILDGRIGDGSSVTVTYSYAAYSAVEALTAGSGIFELTFGGLNEANSNSPVILDIWRLQISAASNLPFLSDDFASLEVTGKVLMDPTKTGAGISKYFRVQMA